MVQLVSAFTKCEQKRKGCVDFMLGVLVYENVSVLKEIVHKEVEDSDVRSQLKLRLTAITDFLK